MKDKISIQGHWFDKCKRFTEEQLKDIYYYVIRYWLYEEEIGEIDDPAIDIAFAFIKDQIDLMDSRAEKRNDDFQKANEVRHKGSHEDRVKELLLENPKLNSREIAEMLGIKDSTVRGYNVWKQRKVLLKNVEKTLGPTENNVGSTSEGVDYIF